MTAPTKLQRTRFDAVANLGCIIPDCNHAACIHHCETGMGGRKNHDRVLPLCYDHHQGKEGIHTLSRRVWQKKFGTEQELMDRVSSMLGEMG